MVEVTFWATLGIALYTYAGYPLMLYMLAAFRSYPKRSCPILPSVTIIITVHNERDRMRAKLENTLSLDYPSDKTEIIVASDGSNDGTNQIAAGYGERGVCLVALEEHRGKEAAQKEAIRRAKGEILIFTDVSTTLQDDAVKTIVMNFADTSVGCVSSEDVVLSESDLQNGEGLYIRYDMLVRRLESRIGSLVGLSGSCFAVRRDLAQYWPVTQASDFSLALIAVRMGYRTISDESVKGYYRTVRSQSAEYRRKVRTIVRGLVVLMTHRDMMNPVKYGLFAFQLISHKLLRYLVPVMMVLLLIANVVLASDQVAFKYLLAGQIMFYGGAILGLTIKRYENVRMFKIPAYFTLVNVSIAMAWVRYLTGGVTIKWEPSRSDRKQACTSKRMEQLWVRDFDRQTHDD